MMNLTQEDIEDLQELQDCAISQYVLPELTPKTLPQFLSAARSEFIVSLGKFDGRWMRGALLLFTHLAKETYGTNFVWSEYNGRQWLKFVRSEIGPESGACMFSAEQGGDLPDQAGANFKGIGLGKPYGMYPYELFPVSGESSAKMEAAIKSFAIAKV